MKLFLAFGALLGLLSVVMGASGDHLFVLEDHAADVFETALRYNMIYALVITALALHIPSTTKWMTASLWLFCIGTTLFCGSLYTSLAIPAAWIIYLTPLGGITLMTAWAALFIAAFRK